MSLSPADLTYLSRLPRASELTYDEVVHLRALRRAVEHTADRSEKRLLDSLLADADRIEAEHHAPSRARARLVTIEEDLTALQRNGRASAAGCERQAVHMVNRELAEAERRAVAEVDERYAAASVDYRQREKARVRAEFARKRDPGGESFRGDVGAVAQELHRARTAEREARRVALTRERAALRRHLDAGDAPAMAEHLAMVQAEIAQGYGELRDRSMRPVERRGPEGRRTDDAYPVVTRAQPARPAWADDGEVVVG